MAKTEKAVITPKEELRQAPRDHFVFELASLAYYTLNGTTVIFDKLPEDEQEYWQKIAGASIIGLDKLNKMIVPKEEQADIELKRNKNINRLTVIIKDFLKGIKTVRCPKCGSNAEVRPLVFPCEELAHKIWDGGAK